MLCRATFMVFALKGLFVFIAPLLHTVEMFGLNIDLEYSRSVNLFLLHFSRFASSCMVTPPHSMSYV
jgi:hypothetical protein